MYGSFFHRSAECGKPWLSQIVDEIELQISLHHLTRVDRHNNYDKIHTVSLLTAWADPWRFSIWGTRTRSSGHILNSYG